MNWKKLIFCFALVSLCAVPSWAGSFGVYGSYWDADEADKSFGAGVRVGFDFVKFLELEFHATHYPDFETRTIFADFDIKATPVDAGLRVNIIPVGPVNPYVGAGFSRYFLDSDVGNIDNETGWYGEAGLDAGGDHGRFFAEVMWRKLETHVSLGVFDDDARFDGAAFNVGGMWRWGK